MQPVHEADGRSRRMTIGRNDPCPCRSGMKYKKCCMAKDQAKQSEALATPRCDEPWAVPRLGASPFAPPPPPPKETTPEEARAVEFERAKTLEARLEVFQRTLDEGSMDDENAFTMINELYGPVEKQQPGKARE